MLGFYVLSKTCFAIFKDAIFTAIPKKLLKDYKQLPLILEINDKIDRMSICPDLETSC
jgi:hypothetical protein